MILQYVFVATYDFTRNFSYNIGCLQELLATTYDFTCSWHTFIKILVTTYDFTINFCCNL